MILASWMGGEDQHPLSPLLVGPPGTGKNRLVYECASMCGKELYIFQGHDDVTPEDIACAVRFSDDPNRKLDYIVSPLVTAMMTGGICFIDELAKIRPRALALLVSVLDERRYIDSNLLGERVDAHPGFRFIAATNTRDMEEGSLPDYIGSRTRPVVYVNSPTREEIDQILTSRYPAITREESLLRGFWGLWRTQNPETLPAPRDALHVFALALSLAGYEGQTTSQPGRITEAHVKQAYNQILQPDAKAA
jgi:MoxR-like ATPase